MAEKTATCQDCCRRYPVKHPECPHCFADANERNNDNVDFDAIRIKLSNIRRHIAQLKKRKIDIDKEITAEEDKQGMLIGIMHEEICCIRKHDIVFVFPNSNYEDSVNTEKYIDKNYGRSARSNLIINKKSYGRMSGICILMEKFDVEVIDKALTLGE